MWNFLCLILFVSLLSSVKSLILISLFILHAGGKLPPYIKTAVDLVETAVPETLEK